MYKIAGLDSAQTIYFNRELEHVISKVFEVQYADLEFRKVIPINHEADPAVETLTVEVYDMVGSAKIISSYADDLPRADVSGVEISYPVRSVGTSFAYSLQEVRASAYTGKPLRPMKAKACMRATEQTFNGIAFNGDVTSGLPGLFSNPNIPVSNVVVGAGASTLWTAKTGDEILFDINDMFSDMVELTKKKERASVLLLPVKQYNYIATTRLQDQNMTIMAFLIANSPWLTGPESIMSLNELDGIGAGGLDVMYIYTPSAEKLEMHIPMELEFIPPQADGLQILVPGEARTGGVHVYYPLSLSRKEGI